MIPTGPMNRIVRPAAGDWTRAARLLACVLAALGCTGAMVLPALAQTTVVWDGSNGTTFSDGLNWVGDSAPANDLTTNTAQFIGTVTSNQPTLTADTSIYGITFNSCGWNLAGGPYNLTVGAGGIDTVLAGNATVTVNANVVVGASSTWSINATNPHRLFLTGLKSEAENTLTMAGSWYNGGVTVTGTTSLAGNVLLSTWLKVAGNSSTAIAGNLKLTGTGGVLSTNANVIRDLGTGAGQLEITGGASGFTNYGSSRITVTLAGNATLKWNDGYFKPAQFVLAGVESGSGGITLTNPIDLNGATRTFYNYGSSSIAQLVGPITNSSGTAAGVLQHTNSSGTTYLMYNSNTFNGPVTVQGGTLRFDTIGDVGSGPTALGNPTTDANGRITLGHYSTRFYSGGLLYSGSETLSTNRQIVLGGHGTINSSGTGAVTFTADMVTVNNSNNSPRTFTLTGTSIGDNTFAGNIIDHPSATLPVLPKAGAGRWILSGNNSYSGSTTVSVGTLVIAHGNALGTSANGTTVASGATLAMTGGVSTGAESLTLAGNGLSSAGALRSLLGENTYSGPITLASANVRINSDSDTLILDSGTAIGGAGNKLLVGGSGNTTIASDIATGSGGLTKDGLGTLVLSGTSSYSGVTTVSAGTLKFDGTKAGSGAVNVTGGATLAGNGSVAGDVSVASGAFLKGNSTYGGLVSVSGNHSPGNSAARQSFSGGLSYASTSTLEWELFSSTTGDPGVNYDQILVTGGDLSIAEDATMSLLFNSPGSTVNFAEDAFWDTAHTWTLIDYLVSGGTSTGVFTNLTSDTSYAEYGNFTVAAGAGDVQLTWTPVPEPSTLMGLAGMAVMGLGGWLWRRRRRAAAPE